MMHADSPPVPRAERRRLTINQPSRVRGTVSPARVVRFPGRRMRGVFVYPAREGGWLVTVNGHGWLHGSRQGAIDDAEWLGENYGYPVRTPEDGA